MKIAVWNNLQSGGGKRALYNHVKGLVEYGHEVISYCPDTANTAYLPLSGLVTEYVLPLKNLIEKKTRFYPSGFLQGYGRIKAMFKHCQDCANLINNNNFDLLLANSSTDFYISHISRFIKIPKIIYLGEPCRYLYEAKPEFLWKAPPYQSNIFNNIYNRSKHLLKMYYYSYVCREEYISAKQYDLILVNSFFSRESVKRAYNLESKVCYLGIDTDYFKSTHENKENYVIGMGFIQPSKGIELAINAIGCVEEKIRPDLVWIGNGKVTEYLCFIKDLAKSKNVHLIIKTKVNDLELLSLLSRAKLFIYFPILEPFGLAPLEANCCETLALTIAEGGPRESIQDGINGFVIKDISYTDLAEKIEFVFNQEGIAESMGAKAREHIINNWNLDKGTENLLMWINKLPI